MNNVILHTPDGVKDFYGSDYHRKKHIMNQIHENMHLYGYQDIETPTFEYFDVFSRDIGTTPSKDLYKFFDKEGNTLVLRPDFTPSVARCAAKYFLEEEMALRFCYEGNVFINTSELQGKLKENTQMGVELIGDSSIQADAEMICMTIDSLLKTGLIDFQISIGQSAYFKGICRAAGMNEETELELRDYLSGKNYFGAEEIINRIGIRDKYRDALLRASDLYMNSEELVKVKQGVDNEMSLNAIDELIALYEVIKAYGYDHYISFDLSMLSKYHYYTGVIFKAYTYGVGDVIVKGGRYDGLLERFGKKSPAIGCVFMIDEISTALFRLNQKKEKRQSAVWLLYDSLSVNSAIRKAGELRQQGQPVVLCSLSSHLTKEIYLKEAVKKEVDRIYIILGGQEECVQMKDI